MVKRFGANGLFLFRLFTGLSSLDRFICQDKRKMSAAYDTLDEANAGKKAVDTIAGETLTIGGNLVIHWDTTEVSNWLVSIGYQDLVPLFIQSNINGSALCRLDDRTLKEIGILNVGTRLQFINEVIKIQAIGRSEWRRVILWTENEYKPNKCCYMLPHDFPCCCLPMGCKSQPDVYTLTNSKINILHGVWFCCCLNHEIFSDNIDLTLVHDIDAAASTDSCGDPVGAVIISSMDGKVNKLKVRSSEAQKLSAMMNNAKEEAVLIATMHAPAIIR